MAFVSFFVLFLVPSFVSLRSSFRLSFRFVLRLATRSVLRFVFPFRSSARFRLAFRFVCFVWACRVGGAWNAPFLSARFCGLSGGGGRWYGVRRWRRRLRMSFLFVSRVGLVRRWRFVSFLVSWWCLVRVGVLFVFVSLCVSDGVVWRCAVVGMRVVWLGVVMGLAWRLAV